MRNRFWAVAATALATGLTACSGATDVFELQVGDCLDSSAISSEQMIDAPTVSCGGSHDLEIFASTQMEGAEFPGPDEAGTFARDWCHSQFEAFVGIPYESSQLTVSWIHPSRSSWEQREDRTVLCILGSPESVTGSLKGSGR